MTNLWAAEWRSKNIQDGESRHILYDNCLPALFRTRRECREYIKARYGYIAHCPDLQTEPHGWKVPKAIKVDILRQEIPCGRN
ncbi:hypothetical protein LCGC14_0365320 [marine sediment metagenome]|uniref:Uncharacterized protein n=1 Tax=marine sediment metagenome TaxID=412755 RepID=A0A0F9VTV4_9ZZZZ